MNDLLKKVNNALSNSSQSRNEEVSNKIKRYMKQYGKDHHACLFYEVTNKRIIFVDCFIPEEIDKARVNNIYLSKIDYIQSNLNDALKIFNDQSEE